MTTSWNLAVAKARFSEIVERAQRKPQIIQRRGVDVAVVLSAKEASRLEELATPSVRPMEEFLAYSAKLAASGDLSFSLPKRRATRGRGNPFEG
jgi:prevent-host-death family protein